MYAETIFIALAGLVGTRLRYWLSGFVARQYGEMFPWGTMAVNLAIVQSDQDHRPNGRTYQECFSVGKNRAGLLGTDAVIDQNPTIIPSRSRHRHNLDPGMCRSSSQSLYCRILFGEALLTVPADWC